MSVATLKTYRQSPRKMRLLADLVRQTQVDQALERLRFSNKKAAEPIAKVIRSAVANARDKGLETGDMIVAEIRVDEGPTLYRTRPRAQGRAYVIRKRTSHIKVRLGQSSSEVSAVAGSVKKGSSRS